VNKRYIITIGIIILLSLAGIIWKLQPPKPIPKALLDAFAKCLTKQNTVMYGAYWCPHCQAQKKLFGGSFQYVKYVECTKEIKTCGDKKIEGYPTWIFKNGERIQGEVAFAKLAQKSTCKEPK